MATPGALYIESSALLDALLHEDARAREALASSSQWLTSMLTIVEVRRVLTRGLITGALPPDVHEALRQAVERFRRRALVLPMDDRVLARASAPFLVEPVRTLDAIHLASMELLDDGTRRLRVLTSDRRVADNARAAGFEVL